MILAAEQALNRTVSDCINLWRKTLTMIELDECSEGTVAIIPAGMCCC